MIIKWGVLFDEQDIIYRLSEDGLDTRIVPYIKHYLHNILTSDFINDDIDMTDRGQIERGKSKIYGMVSHDMMSVNVQNQMIGILNNISKANEHHNTVSATPMDSKEPNLDVSDSRSFNNMDAVNKVLLAVPLFNTLFTGIYTEFKTNSLQNMTMQEYNYLRQNRYCSLDGFFSDRIVSSSTDLINQICDIEESDVINHNIRSFLKVMSVAQGTYYLNLIPNPWFSLSADIKVSVVA